MKFVPYVNIIISLNEFVDTANKKNTSDFKLDHNISVYTLKRKKKGLINFF